MREYLKKYEVTIKTKGPVYIGSGNNIIKKEYYFDEKSERIYFFDFGKLFKGIIDKNLEKEYQEYMFNTKASMDLAGFFKKNGVSIKDVKSWSNYSVDANNIYDMKSFKSKGINTFIKEAGNRNYIPGSSLKGAIRTALLVDGIVNNEKAFFNIGNKIMKDDRGNMARQNISSIESDILRTLNRKDTNKSDAVNDIMSCIKVSDSEVIPNEYMTLCQRMDRNVDGDEHNLPIYYECIKPDVTIKTSITIDSSMDKNINIDRIQKAISNYSERLDEDFSSYFPETDKYSENTLLIGGYTGFPSKTIVYPLLKGDGLYLTQKLLNNSFRKHKHLKDADDYDVSPRMLKVAEYNSKKISGVYEMGRVEIDFKEIK